MIRKTLFLITAIILLSGFQSFATVINIAHRGCSSLAPENTYSAWVKAIEAKADYFELDIQLSSDDSLMIMHDNTLDRTTDGTGSLSSFTYAQLRALDAGSWFSTVFTGEKIPTFAEALKLAKDNPDIDIVAEIKSSDATIVQKVVKMIQDWNMQSRVILSSFTSSQLAVSKFLDTSIDVQLFGTITTSMIDQVASLGGEWVGSGGSITNSLIEYAHSKNIFFNAWTINSSSQMLTLIGQGIDAITTNYPQTLVIVSDVTAPTDVVIDSAVPTGETKITLKWGEASDPESGIAGYEIYRDINADPTTLYTTVGDTTEFIDETYNENKTYHYRIKAKNAAGLLSNNYSNNVSATTLTDATKPTVSSVTSKGDTFTVYVQFSERVEQTTAETKTNYSINKNVKVLGAKLALDLKTVTLTTTSMTDTTYTITVKNITDRAITANKMVTSSTIFRHYNMASNMIAYYKLDDVQVSGSDTLILDGTSNANNGTIKNGAFISEGLLGNALEFDGVNDFVQFTTSSSFDINGPAVTVSLWTKLAYVPADLPGAYGPLFDSDGDQYVLYEDKGNNELRFKTATTVSAERPGIPGADLIAGEWIHVVGVYDGSNAKIYLNGVLKDSHSLTGNVKSGQVAMLGKSGVQGTPSYFKGKIDHVEVFNRALSPEEIFDIYSSVNTAAIDPHPSDVILDIPSVTETDVQLTWQPSVTYESVIVGYEIYRDLNPSPTTLIATVDRDQTSFLDATNTENKTFYYRVRAKNSQALLSQNYSNEVTATTTTDTKPPQPVYITSYGEETKVIVEFSEMLDESTAENKSNYVFDNGVSVQTAVLALDGKSVILTTTPLSNLEYVLMINNLKDRAAIQNTIAENSSYVVHHFGFPPNLIAYYSMDEARTDTLFDFSPNKNNGTIMSSSPWAGYSGNALGFNGVDNYVQFSSSPSFDITSGKVTVSVWTKLNYLPTEMTMSYGPLFDSQGDQYVIYADKGNKELRFKAATTGGAARPGIAQADLITGKWINVVGVYDGANAQIYMNGVLKGTLPLTGTVLTGQVAMLGKSGTTGTISYLNGQLDNVAIFDRALSTEEISQLYSNCKMPVIINVPVELSSFTAETNANNVNLKWSTATETNNAGFEIQKSSNKTDFIKIGFVAGFGTSTEKHSYSFIDRNIKAGNYYYRLKQIDLDGSAWYSQIVESGKNVPKEYSLSQNFPNPFNPETKFNYELPVSSKVNIRIFDALGREVANLVNEEKEAGTYEISFNGAGYASGIYFFRMQAGNYIQTRKMILMK
ncbi:MAG: T9SS C-terminal target domain-containing protein [Ignavibacteriales bacterium]|nr:MAG: T9SS C-terminal target domain-containing protein [Ignavibacteriales bacterium]